MLLCYCHSKAPFSHSKTKATTKIMLNHKKTNIEVTVTISNATTHGTKNIISKSKTMNNMAKR